VIVKSRQLKERTLKCVLISFYFFLRAQQSYLFGLRYNLGTEVRSPKGTARDFPDGMWREVIEPPQDYQFLK